MMHWQAGDSERVFSRDVQQGETVGSELFGKKFFQRFSQGKLPEAGLDGNLPNAGHAEESLRVLSFQEGFRLRTQLRGVGYEPEEGMCVGEDFHSM